MSTAQISKSQCRELQTVPGWFLRTDAAVAMDNAIRAFGKDLLFTGTWRSYETQEEIFRDRYRAGAFSPYGDYRAWNGELWGRVKGAAAAVPGTSNHGGGVAVDVKTKREAGDPVYATAVVFTGWSDKDRTAFLAKAKKFGWADDEGRSVGELWHLTYYSARDQYRGKVIDPNAKPVVNPKPKPATKRKPHRIATIKSGAKGWRVLLAQEVLKDSKDYTGKTDGVFGPKMVSAVKRFQKRAGLRVDGVVGTDTWYSFTWGVHKGTGQNRKNGYSRARVAQRVCGLHGDQVDGMIGATSFKLMKEVQRWLGVDPDGIWRDSTRDALVKKG